MSTTDDDGTLEEIRALAEELGLRRRPYEGGPGLGDPMLAVVLASPRRKSMYWGRRVVLALAGAAVVVGGFALVDGDRGTGTHGPTAAPPLARLLDGSYAPVRVPTLAGRPPGEQSISAKATDDAIPAGGQLKDGKYAAALGGELFRSNCADCRNAVGPVDTVVLVGGMRRGLSGERATVARTFRGTVAPGQRIVIRQEQPTLELEPGLGSRRFVYFLRTVGTGVYSNAASAYVEARPGHFVVGRMLPASPVQGFTLEQLERATR